MAGDDDLDDLTSQVLDALDAFDLGDGALRGAVTEGLREALREALGAPEARPSVVVLRGGRDGDPPTEEHAEVPGAGPDLEVLEGGATPDAEVQVRVLGSLPHLGGAVSVQSDEWQLVYAGPDPYLYRVTCRAGAMALEVDGDTLDILRAGQTSDLCGQAIRVCGQAPESMGDYRRLID